MNSLRYQPNGYVVIPNGLKGTNENINLEVAYSVDSIKVNGKNINRFYSAFTGQTDYTQNGLAGYQDDLVINRSGRLLAKSIDSRYLADDEVIITVALAKKLYPELNISNGNADRKFDEFKGDVITVDFETANGTLTKDLTIVGVARDFSGNLYLSHRMVAEVYQKLGSALATKYGVSAKNLGDEGGFAPAIGSAKEAL